MNARKILVQAVTQHGSQSQTLRHCASRTGNIIICLITKLRQNFRLFKPEKCYNKYSINLINYYARLVVCIMNVLYVTFNKLM